MVFGCLIAGFLRVLLGYYAASSGHFLPTFRDKLAAPSLGDKNRKPFGFPTHEGGNDRLSRNVHKKLPLLAA